MSGKGYEKEVIAGTSFGNLLRREMVGRLPLVAYGLTYGEKKAMMTMT